MPQLRNAAVPYHAKDVLALLIASLFCTTAKPGTDTLPLVKENVKSICLQEDANQCCDPIKLHCTYHSHCNQNNIQLSIVTPQHCLALGDK